MPIEIKCTECQSKLRVKDSAAGRKARCPKCNLVIQIPGVRQAAPAAPTGGASENEKFYVDSAAGATYGPISKIELDDWVAQNRITAECSIRTTSGRTAKASKLYPALAAGSLATGSSTGQVSGNPYAGNAAQTTNYGGNPYAPTSTTKTPMAQTKLGPPGVVDLNHVFNYAWQIFTNNMGLLIAVTATLGAITVADTLVDLVAESTNDQAIRLACAAANLILSFLTLFLGIGQVRIALKLCRGQIASYGDLFQGGDSFFNVIGWIFLIFIPVVISFLLLVIPGLFLVAIYWPSYYLIIDKKTGVFESFSVASKMGTKNMGSSFLLGLAAFGIMLLGYLACLVGALFAGAYVSVLWATVYLMMTGEIRAGATRPR